MHDEPLSADPEQLSSEGLAVIPEELRPAVIQGLIDLKSGRPNGTYIFRPTWAGPGNAVEGCTEGGCAVVLVAITWDYPGLFATLTGMLSASGFGVERGIITTTDPFRGRRAAVDVFYGSIQGVHDNPDHRDFFGPDSREDLDYWVGIWEERIGPVMSLMEQAAQECGLYDQSRAMAAAAPGGAWWEHPARIRARQLVLEAVSARLGEGVGNKEGLLLPMDLAVEQIAGENGTPIRTRLTIRSKDTPFFLYSVSAALSLHQVSIESVQINTSADDVSDIFDLTDSKGQPILDQEKLSRIRLSMLLCKQFTFFLDQAPDPARALERFDSLLRDIVNRPEADDIKTALASPSFQRELAVLLGTSDFIWEDFIRLQHENLRPLFTAVEEHRQLSLPRDKVEAELRKHVSAGTNFEDKKRLLNEFKDRQSFLIDLDHILVKDLDFFFLSRRLTALAEAVVRCALDLAWQEMSQQYGEPRTVAGVGAEWAVFGLGKLGGSALGYASDIELLFVYSDNGQTDGGEHSAITNRDFFERFFKAASMTITSRREGIFQVDLRLRPYGIDGPIAVKLESFAEYFGIGGQAHSAEKLSLIRLRRIGGSKQLGDQVMALRDRLVYESDNIDIPSLRELRRKQLAAKGADAVATGPERVNAKFSPGALVDLEYNVQILQIIHGRTHPELRVSGIHEALRQLSDIGTIEQVEAETVIAAYRFLRNLINGLRMLRGNAQDLFLPDPGDIEYQHLARRMGYVNNADLSAAEQLRVDFANHTARVRTFVERHLGRDAIPTEASGSPADLILLESVDEEMSTRILERAGFTNPGRAMVNLASLAGNGERRQIFARLVVLAWDVLRACPDPDMALNNWEGLVRRMGAPEQHYKQLLSQHKRMELLIRLLSSSQFLADTLQQNPDFFRWITDPRVVSGPRTQIQMEADLRLEALASPDRTDWLNRLRRFRKREILRIGLRDIGLNRRIEEIMGEISFLARSIIEVSLEQAWNRVSAIQKTRLVTAEANEKNTFSSPGSHIAIPAVPGPDRFCILAFGKLGGWELNYSSDIDLLAVYNPIGVSRTDEEERLYASVFKAMVQDLTDFTSEGQAYRVDLRLRPYGNAGPLVTTASQLLDYYEKNAGLWEHQALIKLKPVAGNLALGEEFLIACKPVFISKWDSTGVRSSIKKLREQAVQQHTKGLGSRFEVKNGEGGIRDIEFLVQGLQLIHCREHTDLLTGNTLKAISLLVKNGIMSVTEQQETASDYQLLRRIEHYLQLYGDRQQHTLPEDPEALRKLALSVDYGEKEPGLRTKEGFFRCLDEVRKRVRARYDAFLRSENSATES